MSEDSIVRRTRRLPKKGKTDWERVRKLSDEDIKAAVAADPDAAPLTPEKWWPKHGRLVLPMPKKAVYIRIDRDVVEWFLQQGPRYQTRMNAVLRSYMETQGSRRKRRPARSTTKAD
jgi:uncharacterized protein (DUF4415 family)